MPLTPQLPHLLLAQPRETEHPDLFGNMIPFPWRSQFVQMTFERFAHLHDPAGHRPQIVLPLREQRIVVEHLRRDARAVGRWVRDLAALEDSELRGDALRGVLCLRPGGSDEVEGTRPLAVEAEVLGEGLRDAELETFGDEVANSPVVLGQAAGGEALVCAVEEGEMGAGADGRGDGAPLVLGWVDTGGVVGAGVEEDDGALRGGFDGGDHAVEVEAFGLGGEVGVGFYREVDVGEDLVVVRPGRGGHVDCWSGFGEELGEEGSAEMDGACAGDGLEGDGLWRGEYGLG